MRHIRGGTKHAVQRIARPNGNSFRQNLLAFDLSWVESVVSSFLGRNAYLHCAMVRALVLSRIENNARLRPVEPALVMREKSLISSNIHLPPTIEDIELLQQSPHLFNIYYLKFISKWNILCY